jgi:hypothetical protein
MYPIIEQYLSSELSQEIFCNKHGLKKYVFNYWLSHYRKQKNQEEQKVFEPLQIEKAFSQNVEIHLPNGITLKVPIH